LKVQEFLSFACVLDALFVYNCNLTLCFHRNPLAATKLNSMHHNRDIKRQDGNTHSVKLQRQSHLPCLIRF
jgi:hypothetical protein